MSENTTKSPRPHFRHPILVGRIEKHKGEWKLSVWTVFFSPTRGLRDEVKNLVDSWMASGQQEFGVQTPPAPAETSTVFPCWEVFVVGRDIVARPKWGHYGSDPKLQPPEVAKKTVGILHEETEIFAGEDLFGALEAGLWAYSDGGQACVIPLRGFRSEAAEWRRNLLSALQKLEAEAEAARKAAGPDRLRTLKEEGWKEFTFLSSYYGNEPEGDTEQVYLFRPGLDVARWEVVEFSHGDHSQNPENDEFSGWLSGLVEGEDYVEVD